MASGETSITDSWEEQTGSLERILKALMLDLNRLNERVDRLEKTHGPRIDSVKSGLDVLASNVQGFETQEEAIKYQRQELIESQEISNNSPNKLRIGTPTVPQPPPEGPTSIAASLFVRTQPVAATGEDMFTSVAGSAAAGIESEKVDNDHFSLDAKRARARQRWHWALMKIRMRLIRGRIPMTSARIGRENSIAFRLDQAERLVGRTDYKVRFISEHAGPDKVNKLIRTAKWLEETLVGGPSQDVSNISGVLNRLMAVEQKFNAVYDVTAITR